MNKATVRGACADRLLELGRKDKDIIVVCTDSRSSGLLTKFAEELPDQLVEMGIAEQNAVTVSGGMASMGKHVFAVGPASFYSTRSAEQVKVDLAYNHNPVKIIGISGGLSYGALGATHHSLQDIAYMRAIPDLVVELPSDAVMMKNLTDKFVTDPRPAYIRMGRAAVPVLYPEDMNFEIGKAVRLADGTDIAIFTCGQMVWRACDAMTILKEKGINARVYDMHTIKPLDMHAITEALNECDCIMTVEEASIYGGLGGAIAEVVVQGKPVPMKIVGIPDEVVPNGTDDEVFQYYGMNADGIAEKAEELVRYAHGE